MKPNPTTEQSSAGTSMVFSRSLKRSKCVHWFVNRETKTCVKVEWTEKREPDVYFAESAEQALKMAGVRL